jgi:hypothetical protein
VVPHSEQRLRAPAVVPWQLSQTQVVRSVVDVVIALPLDPGTVPTVGSRCVAEVSRRLHFAESR